MNIEEKAKTFFIARFGIQRTVSNKDYLDVWINRFKEGNPLGYMDEDSLAVYRQLEKIGLV
ncbi:MAG: hypothetical protein QXW39_06145 [Candidatus Bathyarchaeia archaeon]